jgi:hypothetical protein
MNPSKRALSHRLAAAGDRARTGGDVVIIVERFEHVGPMMAQLQQSRAAADIVQVVRASGSQELRYRGGGRIRFRSGRAPDSLRGLDAIDLFVVDPRVATSTELEQNMALACHTAEPRGQVIRPGDTLTIGGIVR